MRNHGASERDPLMDYESLATDTYGYLERAGLAETPVMLVGHSLGAKTAMAFAMMYPHLVARLVSLDASPVDRTMSHHRHLNDASEKMIKSAIKLGPLTDLPLKEAIRKIKLEVKDTVLKTALLFNLNADGSF